MLTIRREQIDALIKDRQSAFIRSLARELAAEDFGAGCLARPADLVDCIGTMLAFSLKHGLRDADSASSFIRMVLRNGYIHPADLPALSRLVLSATAVAPELKLRMLEDVLAVGLAES